jgi:hypothetical protein
MTITVERANEQHVWCFGKELTPVDDEECRANGWRSAFEAYATLLDVSAEAYAACVGQRVACLLGVRPRNGEDGGTFWFHSVALFVEHGRSFLRLARPLFASMLERWPALHCDIDPRNVPLARLATWVGFELAPPAPVGPRALVMHHAVLRRPVCAQAPTAPQP